MNEGKWLFIGTDQRLKYCKELMETEGYACHLVQTDNYSEELAQALIEFKPQHIVCPVLGMKDPLPIDRLEEGVCIYTGVASDTWLSSFLDAGIKMRSYLKEEIFIWENARLTAEALLNVFYSQVGKTILHKKFQVAGYGRVGKIVAETLHALGGKVTILARDEQQLGEALARGYSTAKLDEIEDLSDTYLINTIPTKWFSVPKEAPLFILDLASAPGCLINDQIPEYYTILPGLPGKHFPLDAAIALKGALERIYER